MILGKLLLLILRSEGLTDDEIMAIGSVVLGTLILVLMALLAVSI